ncbi:MAG: DUF2141 domain-containing protein [Polyangiaceae bacterium]
MNRNARHASIKGALALVFTVGFGAFALADEAPTSKVLVNVGTFRNQKGALGCRLYRGAAGFPEASTGTVEKRVPITAGVTGCAFENVAPGVYAISVMHDENGNQKLDKNLFGVPTEGYGVSNNHTHALSSPTWDESKFVVEPGKNVGLGISLRY